MEITIRENIKSIETLVGKIGTPYPHESGRKSQTGVYTQREVKFVEGGGIDIDWTDTDNGTDGDPYDLTFTVSVTASEIAAGTLVTESEGISSNDNDTTIPTSAAVKDFVDSQGFADIGLIIALG